MGFLRVAYFLNLQILYQTETEPEISPLLWQLNSSSSIRQ